MRPFKWLLSMNAYLRPCEAHGLCCEDLSAPVGGRQRGVQSWTLTIAPSEWGETSKVGISDDTDTITLDEPPWLGPLLASMCQGCGAREPLLPVTCAEAMAQWTRACEVLRIKAHRYQLRHAGAFNDTLSKTRSQLGRAYGGLAECAAECAGGGAGLRSVECHACTGGAQGSSGCAASGVGVPSRSGLLVRWLRCLCPW